MSQDHRQQLERVKERLNILKLAQHRESPDQATRGRQDEILGLLATVTENISEAFETRGREHTQIAQQIATIEAKVEHIRHDIGILCKLVRDGNGQPSIIQRLANAETVIQTQVRDIEQISQYANSIMASRMLTRSQMVTGLAGMIVTALLSTLALIATLAKP
jgi:tetrahydromethanopterin S-methyltransferase subunit F